ncbi:MAG: Ni/Fe-hydrogenase, b-type cytochrome subunit [Thermodesulfovibrionales bacterium]|nr:Ni/Fe-hydrogenase, b-type cytochrome subunit [Thermodesulfovibrionales bacterium]
MFDKGPYVWQPQKLDMFRKSRKAQDKRLYVWQLPVRLSHWLNILTITTLIITGYYISDPFMHAISEDQSIMAKMRFIHFVSAHILIASAILRIYWLFAGNKFARLKEFFPYTKEKRKEAIEFIKFYSFLKKEVHHPIGHNALAAISYSFTYFMIFLAILTGYALYSESHTGFFWYLAGGWVFGIISDGTIRLIHHSVMWVLTAFLIVHVYIVWLNDNIEGNGLISSIFTGYKIYHKD